MRSPRRRRRFAAMAGVAAALTLLGTAVTGAAVAMTGARNDTGGAPAKAVLTGVPGMAVDGVVAAGAVELRTKNGNRQLLTAPEPIAGARFGDVIHDTEIGKLYFNLERYALIGAPGLTVDGESNAGGIYVYKRDQDQVEFVTVLTQADPEIPGEAQTGAEFGSSIDSYVKPDQTSAIAGSST